MKLALTVMVLAGLAIGFMMPSPPDRPAVAAAAPQAEARDEPVETVLEQRDNGHFYAYADVNGRPVRFVIDTGASTVALTVGDAERIGIDVLPAAFDVVGTGASGPVRGQRVMLDSVVLDGKRVERVRGVVLEGLEISLLGQAYLNRIGSVTMRNGQMRLR